MDKYISICWENVQSRHSTGREFLYVTEVPSLIDQLLQFVGQPSLITKEERQLLDKIIRNKPLLRIQKQDVPQFMLLLVRLSSMLELLQKRAHTTEYELSRLVDAYPSLRRGQLGMFDDIFALKYGKPNYGADFDYPRPRSEQTRTQSYPKPQFRDDTDYARRRDSFADDVRATRRRWGLSEESKTQVKREPELAYLSTHRYKLPGEMEFPEKVAVEEDSTTTRFWRNLHREDDTLFGRLWPKSKPAEVSILPDSSSHLKKRIEDLELLCRQYEQKIAERGSTRESLLVEELRRELDTQRRKTRQLEIEMKITNGQSRGIPKLRSLPILREILMYYECQDQKPGIRQTFLSAMAMVLAYVIICNTLKFVFYVTLSIAGLMASQADIDGEQIQFSLLEQWPWLEYNYYGVLEWFGY